MTQDHRDPSDQRDHRVREAIRDHKELGENQVRWAQLDQLEVQVNQDQLAHLVQPVRKVSVALKGPQDP